MAVVHSRETPVASHLRCVLHVRPVTAESEERVHDRRALGMGVEHWWFVARVRGRGDDWLLARLMLGLDVGTYFGGTLGSRTSTVANHEAEGGSHMRPGGGVNAHARQRIALLQTTDSK